MSWRGTSLTSMRGALPTGVWSPAVNVHMRSLGLPQACIIRWLTSMCWWCLSSEVRLLFLSWLGFDVSKGLPPLHVRLHFPSSAGLTMGV